jgi:hypothetical protein
MHVNTTDTECKLKLWTSFVVGIILYVSSNYRRYTECKYLRTKQYLQEQVKGERTPREDDNARERCERTTLRECENARMRENAVRGRHCGSARMRESERTPRECERTLREDDTARMRECENAREHCERILRECIGQSLLEPQKECPIHI